MTAQANIRQKATYAQQTTANIPVGGIEKLLLLFCYPSSSFCHQRMRKTDLKIILPFIVARCNHDKTKKRLEQIIPWRRYHLHLDVVVWKEMSLCRHAGKVAETVVVALIFNIVAMEKTIPPFPFACPCRRRGNKSLIPRNLVWRNCNPKDSI
jgi:hypothetical protein